MKILDSIKFGGWFLIIFNLIMGFGIIWVFTRMTPAIETIINQNQISITACEKMLVNLILIDGVKSSSKFNKFKLNFLEAFNDVKKNITEKDEDKVIDVLEKNYEKALKGDIIKRDITVDALQKLTKINRDAMIKADKNAKRLGNAGAWGVVFMVSFIYIIEILFIKNIKKNLIEPFEEIYNVVKANRDGDNFRRCIKKDISPEIKNIFNEINDLLDKKI